MESDNYVRWEAHRPLIMTTQNEEQTPYTCVVREFGDVFIASKKELTNAWTIAACMIKSTDFPASLQTNIKCIRMKAAAAEHITKCNWAKFECLVCSKSWWQVIFSIQSANSFELSLSMMIAHFDFLHRKLLVDCILVTSVNHSSIHSFLLILDSITTTKSRNLLKIIRSQLAQRLFCKVAIIGRPL